MNDRDIIERIKGQQVITLLEAESAETIEWLRNHIADIEGRLEESERQWDDLVIAAAP